MESYQTEAPLRQATQYVVHKYKLAGERLGEVPSSTYEILYFLAFIYWRILPHFGIYLGGGFGTAQFAIMIVAGLIVFTKWKKLPLFFYGCVLFPVLISASMWLVDATIYPGFWRNSLISIFISTLGTWIGEAIIISYLMMRPGFIKRLVILMFITVVLLLHFSYYEIDFHVQRLSLHTNGFLANSNDLASWTGFCAICLTMWAFSARSWLSRIILMICSIICFDVVAQTVSRASMILSLVVLALFFVVRTIIFKRGLSTLLIVVGMALVVYMLLSVLNGGNIITNFTSRLEEDSGRDVLWSLSLPIVMNNPLGIGSETIFDPGHRAYKGPHNVLLYFGLMAGWLPVILTILFYLVSAIRMRKTSMYDGFLWIPALLIFCVFEHNQSNLYIFELWSTVTFCLCMLPAKFEFLLKEAPPSSTPIALSDGVRQLSG